MAGVKKDLGYDKEGFKRVMRKRDYMADMSGQFALGLMANLVGQLQYFYTDKVGLAVGSVGVVLLIAKIVDALTDIWVGNIVDHSKGGNRKYYTWMMRMAVPAGAIVVLMFTVPIQAGQFAALAYALITNLLITAVIYTLIATPFAAAMVVRTKSQSERGSMGVFRAVGNYGSGMIIAIATIPITNLLGGTQSAWIKYGAVIGLTVILLFLICYFNGRKAEFAEDEGSAQEEEDPVPFKSAVSYLFRNKYWVIVLVFNLITSVTNGIVATSGAYYTKWIFGNDNLVGIMGAAGLLSTAVGFAVSKPIISKLGVQRTVYAGLIGAAAAAGIRCLAPASFTMYLVTSLLGSFIQIPLMCLYGVLLAMAVDYNEYKYDKKLVAVSSGAIGFGSKVGNGVGSLILSAFLMVGAYDATLEVATTSMRFAIYGFANYLPLVLNLVMFFIFTRFDIEKKLPAMRKEIEVRHAAKKNDMP
ncbi:MFS transporter [Ruminococcaceae bacterium OttesenSCG-928-D13]|nr:MFS transporter [Ruminococcaceae bacterium OttesenSCG-928-D13]